MYCIARGISLLSAYRPAGTTRSPPQGTWVMKIISTVHFAIPHRKLQHMKDVWLFTLIYLRSILECAMIESSRFWIYNTRGAEVSKPRNSHCNNELPSGCGLYSDGKLHGATSYRTLLWRYHGFVLTVMTVMSYLTENFGSGEQF